MSFAELSEFDFHARIAASSGTALVMFSGPDCGACRRLEKYLPEWLSGRVNHFFLVNVQRSTALAREYEVFHLPGLFVFVNGHFHGPLHAPAAPMPMIDALMKLISEPAHEEP